MSSADKTIELLTELASDKQQLVDILVAKGVTASINESLESLNQKVEALQTSVTSEERSITPTKSTQSVLPQNADYLSKVTVNPIPDEYIIPSGTVVLTKNNTTYNVASSSIAKVLIEDTSEGSSSTPTPDITLIEKTIVANGEYNAYADGADGFSKVIVDVESGNAPSTPAPEPQLIEKTFYNNGVYNAYTYGADGFSTVTVEVDSSSPLPIEVATEEAMNELLYTSDVGSVYKYMGTTTDTYENGALYVVAEGGGPISFSILGTTYQAEEGMTWGEWVANTAYNTDSFKLGSDGSIYNYFYGEIAPVVKQTAVVYATDYIINGGIYGLRGIASGGDTD